MNGNEREDWRWIIVLVSLLYSALVVGASFCGGSAAEKHLLQGLGVPALDHPFMDIRGVAAWCEASARGQNPAIETTYITVPGEKPIRDFLMNYSPIVLTLGHFGLDQQSAPAWALVLVLLYAVSLWFLSGRCSLSQAFFWLILILSPSSVLVVERGNLDIVLFFLIITALLLKKILSEHLPRFFLPDSSSFSPLGRYQQFGERVAKKIMR
jgi:hypothetical protein